MNIFRNPFVVRHLQENVFHLQLWRNHENVMDKEFNTHRGESLRALSHWCQPHHEISSEAAARKLKKNGFVESESLKLLNLREAANLQKQRSGLPI